MKLKHKTLLYNFLTFALVFLIARFGLVYLFEIRPMYISLLSAVLAMVVAPKFAVAHMGGREKLVMKWIFLRGFKEL